MVSSASNLPLIFFLVSSSLFLATSLGVAIGSDEGAAVPSENSLLSEDAASILKDEDEKSSYPSPTDDDNEEDYSDYDSSTEISEVYFNASDFEQGVGGVNATKHQGFLHGFVESLTVILVSEIGDKTFFIAAILAMTNNKLTVFLAAISALALMTVLSALLGWVVTSFIPRKYTYYTCTVIMFLFGLKMLWEAWRMKPDEAADIQQEVQEELERRGSIASSLNSVGMTETRAANATAQDGEAGAPLRDEEGENNDSPAPATEGEEEGEGGLEERMRKRVLQVRFNEKSLFGKQCYKIFKLFVNCFTMTFLAEWGDRSQLATIVLASVNDVAGVCVGGVLGHSFCTGCAVLAGALIAKKISVRMVTLIGALVFLGFAVASLFFDPESEEMIKIDI